MRNLSEVVLRGVTGIQILWNRTEEMLTTNLAGARGWTEVAVVLAIAERKCMTGEKSTTEERGWIGAIRGVMTEGKMTGEKSMDSLGNRGRDSSSMTGMRKDFIPGNITLGEMAEEEGSTGISTIKWTGMIELITGLK